MARFCNEGINDALSIVLAGTTRPTFYIGLFTNTTEPLATDDLTDITEPSGSGYARIALSDGDWTVASQVAANILKTFTNSGTDWGDIYGWFMCTCLTGTAGKLYAVQLFTAPVGPYTIHDTETVQITPTIGGI